MAEPPARRPHADLPAAAASWLRAETAHFVLYSELDEKSTRRDAAELEAFRDFIDWAIPGVEEPPGKLEVYLVDRREELQRIVPGKTFASLYQSATNATFVIALGKDPWLSDDGALFTLFHAVVEHLAQCERPFPAWLSAGWAEIYGELAVEAGSVGSPRSSLGARYSPLLQNRAPVDAVLRDDAGGSRRPPGFYQQAWLVLRWLRGDEGRREALALYLRDVCSGVDPVTAMTSQTGLDLRGLGLALGDLLPALMPPIIAVETYGVEMQRYPTVEPVRARDRASYDHFVAHRDDAVAVTVSTLPGSAQDLLPEVLRLETNGVAPTDGLLDAIRERAARWPGDRLAELALVRAEVTIGDPDAGIGRAARFLEAHPDDAEAMELQALGLLKTGNDSASRRAADFASARALLARAMKLAPTRYQVFFLFGELALVNAYSAEGVNALVRAHQLAPTVPRIAQEAAKGVQELRSRPTPRR